MLHDVEMFSDQDVYLARFEIAGQLVNLRGMIYHMRDSNDKARVRDMRALADAVESRLLSVTRPA
jgi:hypothetical protein